MDTAGESFPTCSPWSRAVYSILRRTCPLNKIKYFMHIFPFKFGCQNEVQDSEFRLWSSTKLFWKSNPWCLCATGELSSTRQLEMVIVWVCRSSSLSCSADGCLCPLWMYTSIFPYSYQMNGGVASSIFLFETWLEVQKMWSWGGWGETNTGQKITSASGYGINWKEGALGTPANS